MTLQYVASALFTPLEPLCFRWYGVYTWLATGPSSQAVSEPLPLPSTVIGALIYGLAVANNKFSSISQGPAKDVEELFKEFADLLKLYGCNCSEVALRGPYIISEKGVALHLMGGRLLLISDSGVEVVDPRRAVARGVALRRDMKSVVKHMLYSIVYMDATPSLGGYSIAVDILCKEPCKLALKPVVIRFGSDGRAAEMSIDVVDNCLTKIISSKTSNLFYVASPILLDPSHVEMLISEGRAVLGNISVTPLSKKELEQQLNIENEKDLKHFRTKIQMLATGYDMLRNSLREMYPAIMPGSVIRLDNIDKEVLLKGIGNHSHVGWGTIVSLKQK